MEEKKNTNTLLTKPFMKTHIVQQTTHQLRNSIGNHINFFFKNK